MGVEPDPDGGVEVVLGQRKQPQQVLPPDGAEAVHNVEGVGFQGIDPPDQVQKFPVGVAGRYHGLYKHPVSLVPDGAAGCQGRQPVFFAEGHPDALDGGFGLGRQPVKVIAAIVGQHHILGRIRARHPGQDGPDLFRGGKPGDIRVVEHMIQQKAALDDLHSRRRQSGGHPALVAQPKAAVVAVPAVPEGAVQQLNGSHLNPPSGRGHSRSGTGHPRSKSPLPRRCPPLRSPLLPPGRAAAPPAGPAG